MTPEAKPHSYGHDQELLRRFLAGDPAACRTVQGWAREIVGFRPYGIPRFEHDDVVQQSLGMMWKACSREGFALRFGLKAMVRKIVLARCVDHLRRRHPTEPVDESLIDPGPDPERTILEADRWDSVERALRQLNQRCRDVIRLHFMDGVAYAELAERMGLAQATVRVRMFHCIKEPRIGEGEQFPYGDEVSLCLRQREGQENDPSQECPGTIVPMARSRIPVVRNKRLGY